MRAFPVGGRLSRTGRHFPEASRPRGPLCLRDSGEELLLRRPTAGGDRDSPAWYQRLPLARYRRSTTFAVSSGHDRVT